jgi:tripartite-type tricarboxylate transporter receptor subunit TctC
MRFAVNSRLRRLAGACALVGWMFSSSALAEETYPSRAITIIFCYSAVNLETVIRPMTMALGEKYGQQFILEPRPGANGAIGMSTAAHAKPDGYTLVFTNLGPTTILPAVQKNLPYDSGKDFAPVFMLARAESWVLTGPSMKEAKDLGEIFRMARDKPGTVRYSVVGAAQRLNAALLESITGAKFLIVPYPGTAQAETALLGGFVDLAADSGDFKAITRGGALRAVSTNNATRTKAHPDIAATAEFAPGYESRAWHGILAPAGTPRDRVEKLNRDFIALLSLPNIQAAMQQNSLEAAPISPDEFNAVIQKELKNFSALAKQFNITVD